MANKKGDNTDPCLTPNLICTVPELLTTARLAHRTGLNKIEIFAVRCYASVAYAFMQCLSVCLSCVFLCPSVTFVDSVKTNKYIFTVISPSSSHIILVFPHQTSWEYSDGDAPNGRRKKCTWGRQKSRFWANVWCHCMLWKPGAIHSAATDHVELMTLVAGKRRSLLMAGDNDEVYDKPQRYAEDNGTAFNCTQW